MPLVSMVLIVAGIVYIVWPDIFKRGIWKKTSFSQRIFSPNQYKLFMRVLGIVDIALGLLIATMLKR